MSRIKQLCPAGLWIHWILNISAENLTEEALHCRGNGSVAMCYVAIKHGFQSVRNVCSTGLTTGPCWSESGIRKMDWSSKSESHIAADTCVLRLCFRPTHIAAVLGYVWSLNMELHNFGINSNLCTYLSSENSPIFVLFFLYASIWHTHLFSSCSARGGGMSSYNKTASYQLEADYTK